ncbi:hypothetical protein [Persicirhabdus sediminis]|uniref:Uncharacterized protein n=1 Tax=Persicirhabdus sediminis TaxID=454144 RepID=A0A8J7MDJ7_9BACT|nr:hypothetical protein [Persicirhabdus sediminis]MBK1791829.1 hypothetical protein [Persicirhabdus sediminis]
MNSYIKHEIEYIQATRRELKANKVSWLAKEIPAWLAPFSDPTKADFMIPVFLITTCFFSAATIMICYWLK